MIDINTSPAGDPPLCSFESGGQYTDEGDRGDLPAGALLARGEVVDQHYEIEALLGTGGMAEVYLAVDRWLRRQVALKVTRPYLSTHLEREARVLASFAHPRIVTAHAYGRHRGLPYVVLEHLSGTSLAKRLVSAGDDPFPVDEALCLVASVGEALMPMHAAGFVHCDIKPGNIMCTTGGVVLIDFGLVWDTRRALARGRFYGSPPFTAPEAIDGSVHREQAHQIDVYALGMLLYVLIAGSTPFCDPDPTVVMQRQLMEDAPLLSTQRDKLPPCLSDLVATLIHRDPRRRPADVGCVREALLGIPRGARAS